MKTTAVIMAGGRGERFWPRSRLNCPKQFLSLTDGGKTLLQQTALRLEPLVADEDMYVVSSREYADLIKKQLPQIPFTNILCEPIAKSTAPCIGFAAAVLSKKYEDAMMLVVPSDHLIQDPTRFSDALLKAMQVAKEDDNLLTIGITPTYPETGYGYICFDSDEAKQNGSYPVRRFVEKPDQETAIAYLASGQYLWNSGMFVWKLSSIMKRFEELLPDTYKGLQLIRNAWETPSFETMLFECFKQFKSESIDYGIMEHAKHIFTIPGDFGWDDAGSWLVLERINKKDASGNVILGDVISIDSQNSIFAGGKKLIAAVGLSDLVIVDSDDILLICNKSRSQDVKEVIKRLKTSCRSELL